MTSIRAAMREIVSTATEPVSGAPAAELTLAPGTLEEVAKALDAASEHRLKVLVWGGGSHQGLGNRVEPDVVLLTSGLDRVVHWEPDDLTLVVEAGVPVDRIESMLAEGGQTAALPERAGAATIGGIVAASVSGYRRARFGPTRDRLLEATLVTGDGRVVRGGGRVVKNVTGYDLPRLVVGSLGALGLIGSVCLKLWPLPEVSATVAVDDPVRASKVLYRPAAVLETSSGSFAYLSGSRAEVEAQAAAVGDSWEEGFSWPERPAGPVGWSLRVPPALTGAAVKRIPSAWSYVAQHGVGEITCAAPSLPVDEGLGLRSWAEQNGGALVLTSAPDDAYQSIDPWGTPPPGLAIQRRLIAAFDPVRVLNPGRLPGGL